jgi:hypothetical protein
LLLQKINTHQPRLILAGGLPHNMLMPMDKQVSVRPIQDANFFLVSLEHQEAMATLKELCLQQSKEAVHSILTTTNAMTVFCHCPNTHKAMKIQVILSLRHPTPGAVLRGFDMSISFVCWTGAQVLGTQTYAASMDTGTPCPDTAATHSAHALGVGGMEQLDEICNNHMQNCVSIQQVVQSTPIHTMSSSSLSHQAGSATACPTAL